MKSLVFLFLSIPVCSATAQPNIEVVGGDSLSLGSVNRGEVIERTLTLRNTGKTDLQINEVNASCGCTGTVLSSKTIPPGGTGSLRITFNSKNFVGIAHKSVSVRSNAVNTPYLTIHFTATIVQEISITPQHIWFKDAEVGRTTTVVITLKNEGKERLRLSGYRCKLEGFLLRLPHESVAPGEEVRLTAEFTPDKQKAVVSDAVFVSTSNPRMPELYVPIFGNAKEFRFE